MTTGNSLSSAAILAEINSNLPDQTSGTITPAIIRQILADITASYYNGPTLLSTSNTWNASQTFALNAQLGSNGGSTGTLTFNGSTSGHSSISVNATGDTLAIGSFSLDSTPLMFATSATSARPLLEFVNTTNDANGSGFIFAKSRNTGNTSTSDTLGYLAINGYANGSYQQSGTFQFFQAAASSGSNIPTSAEISVSNASGNLNTTWFFANTGVTQFPAGSFTANGTGTVTITNVLPNGHTATINKWLTILDASGATSYIPVWQ